MKNSNNTKNQHLAEQANREEDKKEVRHTTANNDRDKKERMEEKTTTYHSRGYYSRNGGDKGYRGL